MAVEKAVRVHDDADCVKSELNPVLKNGLILFSMICTGF